MPIEDIAAWAENLELVVLPGIETDIASLEQTVQDVTLAHDSRITAAHTDADQAQARADDAITMIYETGLMARTYTDIRVQAILDAIPGMFAGWADDLTTGITTTVTGNVSAEVAAAVAQATSAAAAAQEVAADLGFNLDDVNSLASQILDTELPNQQTQIDNVALQALQGQSTVAALIEGLGSDSIAEALDLRDATVLTTIRPLKMTAFSSPTFWTDEPDGATFQDKLPPPEEWFVTDDPVFADALDLTGTTAAAIGPVQHSAFSSGNLYKISARFRVLALNGSGNAPLYAGVTTWSSLITQAEQVDNVLVGNGTAVDQVLVVEWCVSDDPDLFLGDGPTPILLSTSANARYAFHHIRHLADGSHIRLDWFQIEDVTASSLNLSAMREERVLAAQYAEDAYDHMGVAVNARTDAVAAMGDANTASVAATSASDLAVRVTSRGSGCLANQYCPADWETWTTAPTRLPNSVYPSGSELRWNLASAATAAGVRASTTMTTFWRGQKKATAFKVEVEFTLTSGSLSGAGILFDFNTPGADNRVAIPLTAMLPQPVILGELMLATGEFRIPGGVDLSAVTSAEIFVMANNNATEFGGMAVKDITIHRIQIYPVTYVEAAVTEQQTAIADLMGNASAGYLVKAQAGGEVSLLELIAADGSAGTASVARIAADSILLDGSVAMPQLVITDLSGNLVPNGSFIFGDLRGWGAIGDTVSLVLGSADGTTAGTNSPTNNILKFTQHADTKSARCIYDMTATAGEKFALKFDVATSGATRDATMRLAVFWYDKAGNPIGSPMYLTTSNYASTAWAQVSRGYTSTDAGPVTAPAGTEFMRVFVQRLGGGAGAAYVTNIEMIKKRAGSTLITPEGITTDVIAANAITADKVTTGELITVSAQIKNAIINNAKIANLSVDTIKIADDSVTKFDYSFTNGSVTAGGNTTVALETLVLSRARNQPAVIHGSVTYNFPANGDNDPAYIQIYDVTNGEVVAGQAIFSASSGKVDIFGVDTRTTSGNTTYRLRIVTQDQASVVITLSKRFIGALNTFK